MPTISSTTTLNLTAGQALVFLAGSGVGNAVADPGGRDAKYSIGPQQTAVGPFSTTVSVDVTITSGSIDYRVDTDGDLRDQEPAIAVLNAQALQLTPSGLRVGGAAPSAEQAAAVRAGIHADRVPKAPQPYPSQRDISTVVSGVTSTIRTLADSIAAGFAVPLSPISACKVLGCATEISSSANMHTCLTAYAQRAVVGMESLVVGNKVSFRFYARDPIAAHYWVFVNDKPASAAPVEYTAGGYYSFTAIDVNLPNTGPNVVTMYASNVAGFVGIGMPNTGAAMPSDRQYRKVAITGDSFVTGTTTNGGSFDSFAGLLAVRYGYDVLNNGIGGTGYVNGGTGSQPFAHASRLKNVRLFDPDEHVFFGSVNDNDLTGVEAAARAAIAAYRAECDCITTVIGVQPTGTDKTLAASLVTARAVRAAAIDNPLVDRYLDPIGCADSSTVPSAFASGTYRPNDRVVVQNAVWALDSDVAATFTATQGPLGTDAASKAHRWRQLTKWLYGGGNAGGGGSGTRAILLGSDNTHYTAVGNAAIASTVDAVLRA